MASSGILLLAFVFVAISSYESASAIFSPGGFLCRPKQIAIAEDMDTEIATVDREKQKYLRIRAGSGISGGDPNAPAKTIEILNGYYHVGGHHIKYQRDYFAKCSEAAEDFYQTLELAKNTIMACSSQIQPSYVAPVDTFVYDSLIRKYQGYKQQSEKCIEGLYNWVTVLNIPIYRCLVKLEETIQKNREVIPAAESLNNPGPQRNSGASAGCSSTDVGIHLINVQNLRGIVFSCMGIPLN